MLNLVFAVAWLVVAAVLLSLYYFSGTPRPRSGNINTQLGGWLALLLAVYNVVRWWGQRPPRQTRGMNDVPATRRPRPRPAEPPNPDFDFTDRPEQPR